MKIFAHSTYWNFRTSSRSTTITNINLSSSKNKDINLTVTKQSISFRCSFSCFQYIHRSTLNKINVKMLCWWGRCLGPRSLSPRQEMARGVIIWWRGEYLHGRSRLLLTLSMLRCSSPRPPPSGATVARPADCFKCPSRLFYFVRINYWLFLAARRSAIVEECPRGLSIV